MNLGQVVMGEHIGRSVWHRQEEWFGRIVGVAQEPEHGEWFLLVMATHEPDTTHWVPLEGFQRAFRLTTDA